MVAALFITLVVALIIGIPVGFAIGISCLVYSYMSGNLILTIIPQRMVEGINSFPWLALPLFVIAGEIMAYGSTPRLMRLANMLVGKIPGGLGASAVVATAFFSAVSGSGVATTAAIGGIMAPEMVKKGYSKGFTASLLACGTLGIVIPPSISMVVYGMCSGVSVGKMFLGGFIPGIITALFLVILCIIVGKKRGYVGDIGSLTAAEKVKIIKDALFPLAMPIFILGSVMSGAVTPTESAAIACVYAFFLAKFVYKELKIKDVYDICSRSLITSAVILFIVANASPFSWILATQNIPQLIASQLLSITQNPLLMMILITILFFFLGTFMETNSTIVLLTPILLPVITKLGIDPIYFGVTMILNLAIGGVTPPLSVCLFTSSRIVGIKIEDTFPDVIYVVGTMVLALFVCVLFPKTVLLLPQILGK